MAPMSRFGPSPALLCAGCESTGKRWTNFRRVLEYKTIKVYKLTVSTPYSQLKRARLYNPHCFLIRSEHEKRLKAKAHEYK